MHVRGPLAILLLATGPALAPGCGGCEGKDAATMDLESERERADAPAPAVGGEPALRVERGRVTLVGGGARLSALLRDLAREAGFALELGVFADGPVFVRLEAAPIRDALAELLAGVAYGADYVFDPGAGGHRLARLRVGSGTASSSAGRSDAADDPEDAGEPPQQRRASASRDDEQHGGPQDEERYVRPWDERDQEEHEAELAARLASADPVQRREAVAELDAESEGLARMLELASEDEAPEVRAAAVEQLGDAESFASLRGVVQALGDPDARVVLQAIESLEETGDASFAPELALLLEHPDSQVRGRASEALEFLAD